MTNHCGCERDEKCTTITGCAVQDIVDDAVADLEARLAAVRSDRDPWHKAVLEARLEAVKSDRDFWQKAVFEARDALLTAELSPMTALEILNKATGRG